MSCTEGDSTRMKYSKFSVVNDNETGSLKKRGLEVSKEGTGSRRGICGVSILNPKQILEKGQEFIQSLSTNS